MAIEIQITTELDNSKTAKEFSDIEKQVKKTTNTLGDLTTQQRKLREEFERTERGTDEFRRLQRELVGVTREIKNVELSIEALDTDQVASEIGGLVGGLADIGTGAILAFGVSEESAEEFLQTFAQVEGAGRLVKGSIEGVQAATKLYNSSIKNSAFLLKAQTIGTTLLGVAQTAYNLVVGTSTGALKLFKLALASTGIGLIIVGIGLLVANFEAVGDAIKSAADDILEFFKPAIDLVIDALQFLGLVESDAAEATRKAEQQRRDELRESARVANETANRQVDAIERVKDTVVEALDFEIRKRKAAGEETAEIEERKLKIILASAVKEVEIRENLAAELTKIREEQASSEISFINDGLTFLTDLRIENNKEALTEQKSLQKQTTADLIVFNIEQEKIETDAAKKRSDDRKKENEQRLRDDKKAAQDRLRAAEEAFQAEITLAVSQAEQKAEFEKTIADLRIESIKNDFDKERALIDQKFEEDLASLEEKGFLTLEAEILLAEQRGIALADVERARLATEQALSDQADAVQKAKDDKTAAEQKQRTQDRIDDLSFFVNSAKTLNDAFNQIQKNSLAEGEKLTEQQQKRQFNRNKAFNIGQALINTAQGITQAIAQFGPPPSPLGIAGIATAGLIGAAQIAAIKSQKFSSPSGSINTGGGGGGGAPIAPTETAAPIIPLEATGGAGESEAEAQQAGISQGGAIPAFVMESNLTTAQEAAQIIANQSSL